ncbi:MAG: ATP synthase subunit C [Acutalibacteraceae bacterium]|jgi:V/A-type H+-transporting ATPase subunit K
MTTLFYSVMIVVPAAVLLASVVYTMKKHSEGQSVRKSLRMNAATFAVMLLLVAGCAMGAFATGSEDKAAAPADTTAAQASDTAAESTESSAKDNSKGLGLLAAGLVTGLAGIGGGIAVAAGAPAAIAATSEDPKAFGKALIFVALGESIALYGVVISILILNKV